MDVEQIAREVEENESVVQEIVDIAEEFFPDYPADAVFQAVQKGKKEKQEKKQLADAKKKLSVSQG